VKVPAKGSSGTTHLSLFLDLDLPVVIEETADLKSWTPVGNAKGLGAEKPADITLTASPATGGSRYWRARVNP
jgi:hypothetical protein